MLKYKWILLVKLFVLFCPAAALCQPVKVGVSTDSTAIMIGDGITLSLSAEYDPQKFQVKFPTVSDTFNHFEKTGKPQSDTLTKDERIRITQKIQITNFDSGVWIVPKMSFTIKPLQGDTAYNILCDSIPIWVNSPVVDTSKPFKPIFGIRSASLPLQQIILYVVLALFVVAALCFIVWYVYKKRKQNDQQKMQEAPEEQLLPHEKALQALQLLNVTQLWQQGLEKEYHTALTDIMRTYLEEQFQINCFEKTSSEIVSQVKRVKALSTSRKELRHLFETADMVKFAKSNPTAEQHQECLSLAIAVVEESYKRIKPLDGSPAI